MAMGLLAGSALGADDTTPVECKSCAAWNARAEPFRIYEGVYYVGTQGLASVLIDTGDELILLDGGLPQSALRILANIRDLGFDPRRVRWLVNSHAHFNHAGGIAALARLTGARVAASGRGADALRAGMTSDDDPQHDPANPMRFPVVKEVRAMSDGEAIVLGRITLTAHLTPGHTPGAVTWTWESCERSGQRCIDFVYADSLNPVSASGFRFSDDPARVQEFETSLRKLQKLPCDALIPLHTEITGAHGDGESFIGRDKCEAFITRAHSRWRQRLRDEAAVTGSVQHSRATPPGEKALSPSRRRASRDGPRG